MWKQEKTVSREKQKSLTYIGYLNLLVVSEINFIKI